MKYGIGITTRNRPEVLASCLQEHAKFAPQDSIFVIVDDCSDEEFSCSDVVNNFSNVVPNVIFKKSETRLGIAKAKNACIAALNKCDHVFLFDDDAWPLCDGWADQWVLVNEANKVGHSMFNVAADALLELNQAFRAVLEPLKTFGTEGTEMVAFSNCFGVMLYFNRQCLDALGGFQNDVPHLYGYEHAQMSARANSAGFTRNYRYLTPLIASDLIYSIDISYCMLKIAPNGTPPWLGNFRSSLSIEESAQAEKNSIIMHNTNVHIPLVDPFN